MATGQYSGFSLLRMLWGNLWARPVRSALSILAIALQVFLVLFVAGLTTGVVNEWAKRVEGVGADIFVQPPNSSIFFALSNALMEESVGQRILAVPGVEEVAPVLVMMDTAGLNVIYGIDYERFNSLSRGFLFVEGRPFQAADEILVDDIKARSSNIRLGQNVSLLGREFQVAGIVAHGKGARFFLPLKAAQQNTGSEARVSMFYVRSNGDTEAIRDAIVAQLPDHRVRSVAEYMTLMNSENLPELKPFVRSMVGVGVTISFLVVLLTMYTLVLERTREIGILKALGASRRDVGQFIVGETLLMAGLGIAVGLLSTYAVRMVMQQTLPTLAILITQSWILRAVVLALVGSVAGSLYPAYRAAGFDPVDALAYE